MNLLLVIFFFVTQVQAFQVDSTFEQDSNGTIFKSIQIDCRESGSTVCKNQCESDQCRYIEPTCVNCAGSSSELLRGLFTNASRYYQPSHQQVSSLELVQLIQEHKLVLLDSQSLFNFYTNVAQQESRPVMNELCPMGTLRSKIALQLDSNGYPDQPIASICETIERKQTFFKLVERQDIEKSQMVNSMSEVTPLKLKFEVQLR